MCVTPGALDRLDLSNPRVGLAEVVEEPGAAIEEDRNKRDQHFVEQARREILLHDVRATADRNVRTAGHGSSLFERDSMPSVPSGTSFRPPSRGAHADGA